MNDRDVDQLAGGEWPGFVQDSLILQWAPQIPNSESGVEYISTRVPYDCQIVSAHVWAKAVASDPQVEIQDDGTKIIDATTVVAGAQTEMSESSAPTRLKAGSELQAVVTTDAGDTIDGLVVTLVIRPYPLGESGVAVS